MKRAFSSQVRRFKWASAIVFGVCCHIVSANAQEPSEKDSDKVAPIDEIVVVVDRDGNPVDIDSIRLDEAKLRVIREFKFEQTKQEEEFWRLRLRSAIERDTSRLAWGYNAQRDAARFRYSRANHLPIDRVGPATVISYRF